MWHNRMAKVIESASKVDLERSQERYWSKINDLGVLQRKNENYKKSLLLNPFELV